MVDCDSREIIVDFEEIFGLRTMEDDINRNLLKHLPFVFDMKYCTIRYAYCLSLAQLLALVVDDLKGEGDFKAISNDGLELIELKQGAEL